MTEIASNAAEKAEGPLGELDDKERNLRRESFNDLWSNKEELNQLYIDIENNNLAGLERLTNFEAKIRESEVNLNIALNDTFDSLGEGRLAEARAHVEWGQAQAEVEQGHLALVKIEEEALIARNNAADKAAKDAADRILDAIKSINEGSTAASMQHLGLMESTLRNTAKAAGINWDDVEWKMDAEERGPLVSAYVAAISGYMKGQTPQSVIQEFKDKIAEIAGIPLPDTTPLVEADTTTWPEKDRAVLRTDYNEASVEGKEELLTALKNQGYKDVANALRNGTF
jgi:hypothetical protein